MRVSPEIHACCGAPNRTIRQHQNPTLRSMYDPLEPFRFERRHDFVVQECRAIDVREVVCWLDADQYRTVRSARLECGLVIEARQSGAARRWYFLCPTCRRRCEHLYLPPGETGDAHAAVEPQPEVYRCGGISPADLAEGEALGGWFAVVSRAIAREQGKATRRHLRATGQSDVIRVPYAPVGNWRCRKCWNLNYASQHFGRTHALRRQLPPRRILSRQMRLKEADRRHLMTFDVIPTIRGTNLRSGTQGETPP